jgi:SpoVK/Ycf46/Vps4 family AAA+-type ATPase
VLEVVPSTLIGDTAVGSVSIVRELFQQAKLSGSCAILIDDIHTLCPSQHTESATHSSWAAGHLGVALKNEIDFIKGSDIWVVATAPDADAVDASLVSVNRIGRRVIDLVPPETPAQRLEIIRNSIDMYKEKNGLPTFDALNHDTILAVAGQLNGCTQYDLSRIVGLSIIHAFEVRGNTMVNNDDFRAAALQVRPSALRSFETTVPTTRWDDIGGSEDAKKVLQECVEWCLGKQKWIFDKYNLSPPKGVLLYGPPGCSKTMLARALACESGMNFISVKGPEVFSKYVGDSEKAVREIFRRARAVAPCVVFIDELDGMCAHRGHGGVADRVIAQFLTELDGLPSAMSTKSDSIIFVAATNRPDNIDGAVLRPGRIDRKVYVGLPQLGERKEIAKIQLSRIPHSKGITASWIADHTEGYSGAEIVAVCKEAAFHAIERNPAIDCIEVLDIEVSLKKIRPRISAKDVEWYKSIR